MGDVNYWSSAAYRNLYNSYLENVCGARRVLLWFQHSKFSQIRMTSGCVNSPVTTPTDSTRQADHFKWSINPTPWDVLETSTNISIINKSPQSVFAEEWTEVFRTVFVVIDCKLDLHIRNFFFIKLNPILTLQKTTQFQRLRTPLPIGYFCFWPFN